MASIEAWKACTMSGTECVDGGTFGCDYCADDANRFYGHVTQIGSSDARRRLLLRCPRCSALYEHSAEGDDHTRRLSADEARELFPGAI